MYYLKFKFQILMQSTFWTIKFLAGHPSLPLYIQCYFVQKFSLQTFINLTRIRKKRKTNKVIQLPKLSLHCKYLLKTITKLQQNCCSLDFTTDCYILRRNLMDFKEPLCSSNTFAGVPGSIHHPIYYKLYKILQQIGCTLVKVQNSVVCYKKL